MLRYKLLHSQGIRKSMRWLDQPKADHLTMSTCRTADLRSALPDQAEAGDTLFAPAR